MQSSVQATNHQYGHAMLKQQQQHLQIHSP